MGFKVIHNVHSLHQAKEILKEHGVAWDRTYQTKIGEVRRWGSGIVEDELGIHLYFNDGEDKNVAWYTGMMDCVAFYTDGDFRQDGTPYHKRMV